MQISIWSSLKSSGFFRALNRNKKRFIAASAAVLVAVGASINFANSFADTYIEYQKGTTSGLRFTNVFAGGATLSSALLDGENIYPSDCATKIDLDLKLSPTCLDELSAGEHSLELNKTATDGTTSTSRSTIRITDAAESADYIYDGMVSPSNITDVANGTAKTVAALGLPTTVTIKQINANDASDTGTRKVSITWDLASTSYSASNKSAQVFDVKGMIDLPSDMINPNNNSLSTMVRISVLAAGETGGTGESSEPEAETKTYTLTFNANQGTGAPGKKTCTTTGSSSQCTVTVPSTTPMRADYTFKGWANSSSATSANYQAGSTVTLTADKTVYAVWEKKATDDLETQEDSEGSETSEGSGTSGDSETSETSETYEILNVSKTTYSKNSDDGLMIRGDGDLDKFTELKIDGKTVSADNYTTASGSTIVTINPDYLDTLGAGDHTATLVWTDGEATTTFAIAEVDTSGTNTEATLTGASAASTDSTDSEDAIDTDDAGDDATMTMPDTGAVRSEDGNGSEVMSSMGVIAIAVIVYVVFKYKRSIIKF